MVYFLNLFDGFLCVVDDCCFLGPFYSTWLVLYVFTFGLVCYGAILSFRLPAVKNREAWQSRAVPQCHCFGSIHVNHKKCP